MIKFCKKILKQVQKPSNTFRDIDNILRRIFYFLVKILHYLYRNLDSTRMRANNIMHDVHDTQFGHDDRSFENCNRYFVYLTW